jgi:septation ring formation regulator
MIFSSGAIAAPNFPPKKDSVVQDTQKVMDPSQVKQLSDIVEKLPDKYKVVIVPSSDGETTQNYADELFTYYKMSESEILLVFNMDKEELAVHAGSTYSAKGLSAEVIKAKTDSFFLPNAKQKSYMTGISTVAQQLSETMKNGNKPDTTANDGTSHASLPTWIYWLFGVIILIISLGAYSFIVRRRLFKEMDEIEDWMDAIEEKIKTMKPDLAFEKEGKADAVTALVERIGKEALPTAEFSLLESEKWCDRFRFRKAGKQLQKTKDQLAQIDNEISQLQSKMFQSKVAFEECERLIEEIKKTNAIVERKLDEAKFHHGVIFHDIRAQWVEIDKWGKDLSVNNVEDYLQLLNELKEKKQILVDILKEIERYPVLKQEITISIPNEIRELENGIQEMLSGGYRIPTDHFEDTINQLKQSVESLQSVLAEGHLSGLDQKAKEVKDGIDVLYDSMEEIVTKKGMIQHYLSEIPQTLSSLMEEKDQLQYELEELSLRYRVNEGTIFNYYLKLQNTCEFVDNQLFLAQQMNTGNDLEHMQAADLLAATSEEIYKLIETRDEAYQELDELRKGEYEAQETVMDLHAEIVRIEQQTRRQNLPGVPVILLDMMDEGKNSLLEIEMALNQVPLELQRVNMLVKNAKEFNTKLVHHAESIFYHCRNAEEKIQQTNRFRSHWKDVNELLIEAEQSFRELDFEKAHLLAAKAHDLANQYLEGLGRLNFRKKKA